MRYIVLLIGVITVIMSLLSCGKREETPENHVLQLLSQSKNNRQEGNLDSAIVYSNMAYSLASTSYLKALCKEEKAQTLYLKKDIESCSQLIRDAMTYFHHNQTLTDEEKKFQVRLLSLAWKMESADGNVKEAYRSALRVSKIAKEVGMKSEYVEANLFINKHEYMSGNYMASIGGLRDLLEYCDKEGVTGIKKLRVLGSIYKVHFALGDVATAKQYVTMMEQVVSKQEVDELCLYNIALYYLSDSIKNVALQRQCIDVLEEKKDDQLLSEDMRIDILHVLFHNSMKTRDIPKAKEYDGILMRGNEAEMKDVYKSLKTQMLHLRYLVTTSQFDSVGSVLEGIDEGFYRENDMQQYATYLAYESWYAYYTKDFKKSYEILKRRSLLMDSLKQESISHNLAYKEFLYRRDTTILSQKLFIHKQETEINTLSTRRQVWMAVILISALVAALVFISLRTIRIRRHKEEVRRMNEKLEKEVAHQMSVLEKREVELRQKNKQLREQMLYASNIQGSMLPDQSTISSNVFADYFLIYKPCTLISGDFFWTAQSGEKKFICVGDATGHGIPGAFIAMVSSTILNDLLLTMSQPTALSLITALDANISSMLLTNDITHGNDSVDASMLCIDERTHEITIALARHNAYVVNKNGLVTRYAGVKRSIGDTDPEFMKRPFEEMKLEVESGDCLYMTSDGYESQLGGVSNKKLKRNKMNDFFLKYKDYSMSEQKLSLLNELNDWKGGNEQTDDILMIGMRMA